MTKLFDQKSALEAVDGDISFLKELLSSFLLEVPKYLSEIEFNIRKEEALLLEQSIHKFKSALLSVRAIKSTECASKLEQSAKNRDFKQSEADFMLLKQSLKELENYLTEHQII